MRGEIAEGEDAEKTGLAAGTVTNNDQFPADDVLGICARHGCVMCGVVGDRPRQQDDNGRKAVSPNTGSPTGIDGSIAGRTIDTDSGAFEGRMGRVELRLRFSKRTGLRVRNRRAKAGGAVRLWAAGGQYI
jgi:hypothetical protein